MPNFQSLNLFSIVAVLLCFPSFIQSLVNPVNFSIPPMWIEPCVTGDYKSVNKSALLADIGTKEYYYNKRIRYESYRTLFQIRAAKYEWSLFNFHEFFIFSLDNLWDTYIHTEFLPKYQVTKKIASGPVPEWLYIERRTLYKNLYNWLQRVAVGMEALVHDQFHNEEPYVELFIYAYKDLQVVLCEIDAYMFAFNVHKDPDVDRGIMTDDERVFDIRRYRLTRDFAIIREYINMMEFVYQTADNLRFLQRDPLDKEEGTEE